MSQVSTEFAAAPAATPATSNVVCSITTKVKRVKPPRTNAELQRVHLERYLRSLEGRFVGIDFVKQDGSSRKLNGRLGVRQYAKTEAAATTAAFELPYVVLYDVQQGGYRNVNLATVSGVRAENTNFTVIG